MKISLIKPFATLFFLFFIFQVKAQMFDMNHRGDFPFKVSLGFNIINDTYKNAETFDPSTNLSMVPFPSRISFEGVLYEYLSWETAFSYNKYKAGTMYNGGEITEDWNYSSFDANLKYYVGDYIGMPDAIDPYVNSGLSYNIINNINRTSFAFGGGLNIWPFVNNYDYRLRNRVINRLGFFVQGQAKLQIQQPSNGGERETHLQAAFGMIFKFK